MKIDRSIKETLKVDAAGNCERAKILYVISDAPDSGTAVELVRSSAPENFGTARKNSVSITNSPGGGIFEIAVDYTASRTLAAPAPVKKSGDRVWTCAVNGRNVQRYEAFSTKRYLFDGTKESNPGKTINWNGQSGAFAKYGSVNVIQPELTETCVATFKASKISSAFLKKIADIVGKVNNSSFHHWAAGEVLLTGMSQGEIYENSSGTNLCDLTFNFSIRPNETRTIYGKNISVPGWDYVWLLPQLNNTAAIHMVYVSQVYERADYKKLGL